MQQSMLQVKGFDNDDADEYKEYEYLNKDKSIKLKDLNLSN